MKGILDNNKDIKRRMIFEVYEDEETDFELFGEPEELTADLLDIIISIFASQEKNETGKNNEAIAKSIYSYVLSSLNIVTDKMREGANNDLC